MVFFLLINFNKPSLNGFFPPFGDAQTSIHFPVNNSKANYFYTFE